MTCWRRSPATCARSPIWRKYARGRRDTSDAAGTGQSRVRLNERRIGARAPRSCANDKCPQADSSAESTYGGGSPLRANWYPTFCASGCRVPENATVGKEALQAILDAAVDGVVLIDHRGLIQAFNRSAERIFGYTAAEVIGRNVGILMGDADQAQHDRHIARYLESGVPHIIGRGREVMAQRKGGVNFP